jgi:hypothetical protein
MTSGGVAIVDDDDNDDVGRFNVNKVLLVDNVVVALIDCDG